MITPEVVCIPLTASVVEDLALLGYSVVVIALN